MEKTVEAKIPHYVINHDLDKYDHTPMSPKKQARINEILTKYGLPKEIEEHLKQLEAEQAFWLKGTLNHADMPTNTFSIVAKTSDNSLEKTYNITTSSELVRKTVKEYWGDAIRVHIKPKGDIETATEYELIEVF